MFSKINNLTDGIYAKEYFEKIGLNYDDAKKIREILINNQTDEKIDDFLLELQLYLEISKYCYDKKLKDTIENEITNSYNEKLLIYNLNINQDNNSCSNCKKELINDFKYCPYCGNENIQDTLIIVADGNIDLDKGFITPEEVKHIRFLTQNEEKLVKEGKVKFEDVGIPLDETNSPYEIKNELISNNENLKNNKDLREKLFNKNLFNHKKQVVNYQLSIFEDFNKNRSLKVYPPSIIDKKENESIIKVIQKDENTPLVKPGEKRKKYIKIISKPAISKTKEKSKEKEESINQIIDNQKEVENLKVDLKYAGILYLSDAINHPKNPQITDNMFWLNISSISEVTRYLRNKGYILDAKGIDIIKANLRELSEKELENILTENNLKNKKNKDENIKIICENLKQEQLEQFNKDNAILVTSKGYKFIEDNPQVKLYAKYLYNFKLKYFEQFYQKNKNKSLTDLALQYLSDIRNYYAEKMKWHKYALTYEAESRIYKTNKDKIMRLKSYVNYFICMINPWNDNKLVYSNPIKIENNEELIKIVNQSKIPLKEIREIIINQTEQINLPGVFLSANEIYEYFKRIYDNEDIRKINNELNQKIDLTSFNKDSLEFFTKKEQEEVYSNIKEHIN